MLLAAALATHRDSTHEHTWRNGSCVVHFVRVSAIVQVEATVRGTHPFKEDHSQAVTKGSTRIQVLMGVAWRGL